MPRHAFKTCQVCCEYHERELHFCLYLRHNWSGPRANSVKVVHTDSCHNFGDIRINDWPIYDGCGSSATLVARGHGLQCKASDEGRNGWHNSFTIVFEEASGFKGSTLQVMGHAVTAGDSAIIGGTGEFTMARGVIHKKLKETNCNGYCIEVDIHALYTPMKKKGSHGNAWTL